MINIACSETLGFVRLYRFRLKVFMRLEFRCQGLRTKKLSSLLISSVITTLMLHPAARALPFQANSGDFEAFVNQVWRSGGAGGVNIGPSMRSSNPARESRRYWGFHNCIWKTNPNTINTDNAIPESIGGHAYEIFNATVTLTTKHP